MKYLQTFNESKGPDYNKIRDILSKLEIEEFTINPDGVVDVHGHVRIHSRVLIEVDRHILGLITTGDQVELPITFGTVNGSFFYTKYSWSKQNISLKSLKGFPRTIYGSCHIDDEDSTIESLQGGPEYVGGEFSISQLKKLKSLKGAPSHIGGDFRCVNCPITSLEGLPDSIGFIEVNGSNLTDLKGSPLTINGGFVISASPLTSLDGVPNSIKYGLYLLSSSKGLWDPTPLKNLRDCGTINLDRESPIIDLINFFHVMSGCRSELWGVCNGNPGWENFIGSLDYNYIRGSLKTPQINLFRFMEALSELEWDPIPYLTDSVKNGTKGIGRYKFVDDDGNKVTIFGERY